MGTKSSNLKVIFFLITHRSRSLSKHECLNRPYAKKSHKALKKWKNGFVLKESIVSCLEYVFFADNCFKMAKTIMLRTPKLIMLVAWFGSFG